MRHLRVRRLMTVLAGVILLASGLVATPFAAPAAAASGDVIAFGGAPDLGPPPVNDVVDMAATPSGNGYWTVNRSGRVDAFGDAPFLGDVWLAPAERPIVAIAATRRVGATGWCAIGRRRLHVRRRRLPRVDGRHPAQPAHGRHRAGTASGRGYWLVAADGGVFTFGDAAFLGSMGNVRLNQSPVTAMIAATTGGLLAVRRGRRRLHLR